MKKSTLFTILSVVLANPAYADLNCVSQPSCDDLGYSKTEDCPNGKLLKCPFDTTYSKCIKASSSDESATQTDTSCRIGYIFYSDGSCSNVENYDSAKTPVGVVYALSASKGSVPYTSENELHTSSLHGRVIALKDLTFDSNYRFDPSTPYTNSSKASPFGLYNYDIASLTEYTDSSDETGISYGFARQVKSFFSGKDATAILANQYSSSLQTQIDTYKCKVNSTLGFPMGTDTNSNIYCFSPAAIASYKYYPPNTTADNSIVGQHNWYLPSLGELMLLYGYDHSQYDDATNASGLTLETVIRVNATLKKLKLSGVDTDIIAYITYNDAAGDANSTGYVSTDDMCGYHSSTRYSAQISWKMLYGNRTFDYSDRDKLGYDLCVRPSLEF